MAARKNTAQKAHAACPLDLDDILGNFSNARSVLECAYTALDNDESGDEAVCLRFGLDLLGGVYNELEIAIREGRADE